MAEQKKLGRPKSVVDGEPTTIYMGKKLKKKIKHEYAETGESISGIVERRLIKSYEEN